MFWSEAKLSVVFSTGDWSGGPRGVVVRCVGNGLLSTQKSPNFIFSFTILVIPG